MGRPRRFIQAAALASICSSLIPATGFAQTDASTIEMKILQWMETERLISEESTEWESEKAVIEDMISLMETDKASLQEKIDSANELSSAADEERAAIVEEKDKLTATADAYVSIISDAEAKTRELIPMLPPPFTEEIKPLISRLPEDSSTTKLSLSQRTQNVVGILSQVDKFNSGVTYLSEIKKVSDDQSLEVHTLYFGLAAAYFVDTQGVTAGYGTPSPEGWEWTTDTDLAPDIQKLLAIYQQTSQAEFIELPVSIY
ncbi:DUF3450 family protein [Pelagicoccus albus]|uniref:DUF3450 family protein n=1 Tax=Pelagicoccus albus TaxID=415222 RepID=A0A7X1EBM3_9BACT|nr:DUF3450 family protein [Pelagicoccus albus]MBC2607957.1 DUF3450 family protein [Pelagicoccus albus]